MQADGAEARLESKALGALPVVNHFLRKLDFDGILAKFLPRGRRRGRPSKIAPAGTLSLLLKSLIVKKLALYRIPAWANEHAPEVLELTTDELAALTDERLGVALDLLYHADRRGLVTEVTRHAVRVFSVELRQIHNDTTTVSFFGEYKGQDLLGTVLLCRGFNKDHRPDLKQLVFSVCASADEDVPVHFGLFDGNTNDDLIHCRIWDDLRAFVGHSDFIYVADCKLCTRPNMFHIASGQGKFVTVLPRSRKEDGAFRDWVQTNAIPWNEEKKLPNPRDEDGPPHIFKVFESLSRSSEGYRIVWVWDSLKSAHDAQARKEHIDDAVKALTELQSKVGTQSFKSKKAVDDAVTRILVESKATPYITAHTDVHEARRFKQARPGRPGPATSYVRLPGEALSLSWEENSGYIHWEAKTDGLFPLITNIEPDGSTRPKAQNVTPDGLKDMFRPMRILEIYKGQPNIEKLHATLKSFLHTMPVWLKKVQRIEALLCLSYLALLVSTLIQRQLRRRMERLNIESLPLYPDDKECRRPTARTILELYENQRRHRLFAGRRLEKTFWDGLSPLQNQVLHLLGVDSAPYGHKTAKDRARRDG